MDPGFRQLSRHKERKPTGWNCLGPQGDRRRPLANGQNHSLQRSFLEALGSADHWWLRLTDIYGSGQICYSSYKIEETGPGVMPTSYSPHADAVVGCSIPIEERIACIQKGMVEIHGPITD
ncbi:hypothetical protein LZ31DRAFT_623567 [Colletotrichum somersetense]|nr:hypothetical protein LZ31DRAFT_623567 [Colletotrichum somersetense]